MAQLFAHNFKKIFKYGLTGGIFIVVIVYASMTMKDYLFGIDMQVEGITDGETRTDPKLTIRGIAKNIKSMSINDRTIGVSEDGSFNENILLLPGYNVISIKGDDKFGKHIAQEYRVFLKDDSANATALSKEPSVLGTESGSITN